MGLVLAVGGVHLEVAHVGAEHPSHVTRLAAPLQLTQEDLTVEVVDVLDVAEYLKYKYVIFSNIREQNI